MENIHVIDNFLQPDELNNLHNIMATKKWSFNHTSNGNKYQNEVPFWSVSLYDEPFIAETLTTVIEQHFFKKFKVLRIYSNGQTFGQDGYYHIDNENYEVLMSMYEKK